MADPTHADSDSYRCPRCHKSFAKSSSVGRHLGQPNSTCARAITNVADVELPVLTQINLDELRNSHGPNNVAEAEEDRNSMEIDDDDRGNAMINHELGDRRRYGSAFDEESNVGMGDDDMRDNPHHPLRELYKQLYSGEAGFTFGRGPTFVDCFDADQFSEERRTNLYYPFASRQDWEVGSWLLRSGLSMAAIDEFMSLQIIQNAKLSFSNAKELRARAELLPSGPKWICRPMEVEHPTKFPVHLYYRNALQCLQCLMQNPLHADVMEIIPYKLYEDAEKSVQVFTEWLSGNAAWQMQEKLPKGATLLGTVLSSDKTNISVMTGNRTAYPLIISLANIKKSYRLKNSHDTFLLLALLPVAKFIHKNSGLRGLLHDRLTHTCLDIILRPLKAAAVRGVMMTDPLGFQRLCYTTLASYTVDTPEAQLLACVGGKSSPVTVAHYKHFGDGVRHETRTSLATLAQLRTIKDNIATVSDLTGIYQESRKLRLNGVLEPFWENWFMAEPSIFLTPEPLHHWHKEFWDHDAKWCIGMIGGKLIDFLFSLLQPRVGYRQFREGISTLKQVTGRDHREIQRYMVAIIGCIAPKEAVIAIRSLMDFRYFGQSPLPTSRTCERILRALNDFHCNKDHIMEAGGRRNKKGLPMNNWYITKLELFHHVVPSIYASGSADQWTADITEHTHHTDIKVPARSGNNQNYDVQIVRTLDRMDKCRRFDLATSIKDAGVSLRSWVIEDEDDEVENLEDELFVDNAEALASRIAPVSNKIFGTHRSIVDYFSAAERLLNGTHGLRNPPPIPLRIFCSANVAFQLARDPQLRTMTIDNAAQTFMLPDLRHALSNFISHVNANGDTPCRLGGRRAAVPSPLSFENIQVWTKLRIQSRSFHDSQELLPAETLNCLPPGTSTWQHGLYDSVLINTDAQYHWPQSQLKGHSVGQLRLIFRAVPPRGSVFTPGLDGFLCYVQRFDVIPQTAPGTHGQSGCFPDPVTGMYALRRSLRSDGSRQGSVIQIKHIQRSIHLVSRFRRDIDPRVTRENCMEHYSEFWLNDYFDKDTFYAFRCTI